MSLVIVQKADASHIEKISKFQVLMARETEDFELDIEVVRRGVTEVFKKTSHGEYFVCILDNEIVASLMITYEWSDWRNRQTWWIQSVFVKDNFRGQGIFKAMYLHIKNIVQNDDSLSGLRLYVDKTNYNAQKVYQKIGMDGNHYSLYEWMK